MTRHAAVIGGQDAKNPPPPRHAERDHGAASTGTPPARTRREEWPVASGFWLIANSLYLILT